MTFAFRNLHAQTRQGMANEINAARDRSTLYHSTRFNDQGRAAWPGLLAEAAGTYDEHWLAYHLDEMGCFKGFEYRAKPNGGYTTAHVPQTASETLADAEFNRYYMIAVCEQAHAANGNVTVYRAKERGQARGESEAVIGSIHTPAELLPALRALPAGAMHFLLKPNSGLSLFWTEPAA
jgi:hypothetical protein